MATDLDVSPLAAEIVLQALRPVVDEHFEVQPAGASLEAVGGDDGTISEDTQ